MSALRNIPKMDKLLELPAASAWLDANPRPVVLRGIRNILDELREEIRSGKRQHPPELQAIAAKIDAEIDRINAPSLKRVVNGTGIVIHTNLGRSPLPEKVAAFVAEISRHYSNLEYDLSGGDRGDRYSHVEPLICEILGAEAALVVNNNAAALLLALSSLAKGREVVVSRGELVEIGGSFRIPDVMVQSGAILREVGTTNRTHLKDYKAAITTETGLLLKVSCSNFAMVGFTAEASTVQLSTAAQEAGIPLLVDAGSGAFLDLEPLLGCKEQTVRQYLLDGADAVVCSGDKLLGGPQIGIIAGRKSLVEPMKKHPLLRALRVDKMTLAALEGVLRLYRDEKAALSGIPTLRMLTMPEDLLAARCGKMLRTMRRHAPKGLQLSMVSGSSMVGGGALPQLQLATSLISLKSGTLTAGEMEARLRSAAVPVIGRISKGVFLLDVRTIMDDDLPLITAAIKTL